MRPVPEPSPDALALAAIAPSTLRVDVENGSGLPGVAHRVAEALRKSGFTIGDVGDASRSDYVTTEIHEHSTVTFAGAKVRESLPATMRKATVVPDPSPDAQPSATTSDVTVIVGSDVEKPATAASGNP